MHYCFSEQCIESAVGKLGMKNWTLLGLVALAGCGPVVAPPIVSNGPTPPSQVAINIVDYKFLPDKIHAARGQTLQLSIKDMGQQEHGLVFDFPEGPVSVPSHVRPNESTTYSLKVPDQPGIYYFHCPVGNHYARGMEGELIVQ